jgi:hypothetical protein
MIQTTKRIVTCALFICLLNSVHAQDQTATVSTPDQSLPESDSAIAARHALYFADSLVKANFYAEWPTYMSLTNPFKEHVVTIHYRNEPKTEEKPEKLKLLHMMNDIDTWQCVIEKVRSTFDDTRGNVKIYNYLIGESTDAGVTWKFIDVSHNSLVNVIYIMPSIFGNLAIPEGKTVYIDEVAAQEAAEAAQPVAKKKPVVKKPAR